MTGPEAFDYLVVGSGAAGCTLAYRLARAGERVLVIEHGPRDTHPLHRIPKGFFFTLANERYTSRYATEPIAGTETRETWTRGRVVGGTTTINGMMWARGSAADFDDLAAATGAAHWGWARVRDAYRAIEDHALGGSESRGAGGPLAISISRTEDEIADRVFTAAERIGWRHAEDLNDGDDERIGYTPSTVERGRRCSAAHAFLRPALRTGNVRLVSDTKVGRLLLRGNRVVGVQGTQGRTTVEFRARKEVVIACGAIESPLLLERSGVGRRDVLEPLGIEVRHAAPNVGERVIEHHSMGRVQVRLNRRLGATEQLNSRLKQGIQGARYLVTRQGPIATAGYDFAMHCKSDPRLGRPDLTGSVTPFALDPTAGKLKLASQSGMLVGMYQTRPETTSSIHSASADGSAPPVIRPRYFETETDARASGSNLRRIRELLAAGPLAEIIAEEELPSAAVPDAPASALAHGRRNGGTIFHAVGSCAMGPGDDDVVDDQLRVRGLDGVRVVDASVLPFHPSANPAAPIMAVAWIAADLITGTAATASDAVDQDRLPAARGE